MSLKGIDMGYRSTVGIKCEQKAFDKLIATAKANEIMPDSVYADRSDPEYPLYTMEWSWVKWYAGYTDVDAVETCLQDLDDLFDDDDEVYGYGYHFIRIGENVEDNEERWNDYDIDFWIERTFPISGEEIEV